MRALSSFSTDETGTVQVDFTVIVALAVATGLSVVAVLMAANDGSNDRLVSEISDDGIIAQGFSSLDRDVTGPFGDVDYMDTVHERSLSDLASDLSGLDAADVTAGNALLQQAYGIAFDGTQTGTVGGVDVSTVGSRQALLAKIAKDYGTPARQLTTATRAMVIADEASYRGVTWNDATGQFE